MSRTFQVRALTIRASYLMALLVGSALPLSNKAHSIPIVNQASAGGQTTGISGVWTVTSNSVVTNTQAAPPPQLRFYLNSNFKNETTLSRLNLPLYIEAQAGLCNRDVTRIETMTITVRSTLSGDYETFSAIEANANSERFRITNPIPVDDVSEALMQANDGRLQVPKNEVLVATIDGCGAGIIEKLLFIDPHGTAFDSRSNQPLAGVNIILIDVDGLGNGGHPEKPAKVFDVDGREISAALTTSSDGVFQFPLVAPSRYRLEVIPAAGYRFPSQIEIGQMPNSRALDPIASFGGIFSANEQTGNIKFDLPLDVLSTPLFVDKIASRPQVDIGDMIDYTIIVGNNGDTTLPSIFLRDYLPLGFRFVSGSARNNGIPITDPQIDAYGNLHFPVGDMEPSSTQRLSYRIKVVTGALLGNATNRAQARSADNPLLLSNMASVKVMVSPGIFTSQTYLLGRVYLDCNRNQQQDKDEPGIAGVRLYLEDGRYAITDDNGRYSLYNVSPRTHILKVDDTTLPKDVILTPLGQRHGGDGSSRFVDVHAGQLQQADFASENCDPTVRQEIEKRQRERQLKQSSFGVNSSQREAESVNASPTVSAAPSPSTSPIPPSLNASEDQSSSSSTGKSAGPLANPTPTLEPILKSTPNPTPSPIAAPLAPPSATNPINFDLLDSSLAFVNLSDGSIAPQLQTVVRVKGPTGFRFQLSVNGKIIATEQVGSRSENYDRGITMWDFIGVTLTAGKNLLQLAMIDPNGQTQASREITITAVGELAKITLLAPSSPAIADGNTPVPISVELRDQAGLLISNRTEVTLNTDLGRWQVTDSDTQAPGIQTFIDNGAAIFYLLPPTNAGTATLQIKSSAHHSSAVLNFTPALRPLLGAGIIEGVLNISQLSGLQPAQRNDAFAQELQTLAHEKGDIRFGSRAALFLKGKVKGDYLLTLAYDSDKDAHKKLLQDIQPDKFYPVYGDESDKGFDAQSTGKLYLRIDHNKSWLLLGDFSTMTLKSIRNLGAYNRSLNGLYQHYETDTVTANAFFSRDTSLQVVEELAANGSSGPYLLGQRGFTQNSEKVELVVRDRNQPALILSATPQTRWVDYEIEVVTGRILFKGPIASLDSNLNPISIRITYEVDQGGDSFNVMGADAQIQLTEQLNIGGSTIHDNNPQDNYQLHSLNTTIKLNDHTDMGIEVAQSQKDSVGIGRARRFEINHLNKKLTAKIYGGRTDTHFDNPNAFWSGGRGEAGAKAQYKFNEANRLHLEWIRSEDLYSREWNQGNQIALDHNFSQHLRGEVGVRSVRNRSFPGYTSLRSKLAYQLPNLPQASIYGEAEQATHDSQRKVLTVGGEYRFAGKGKIYGRHEFISSLEGPYQLNSQQSRRISLLGVAGNINDNSEAFSEYRLHNALDGRAAETATGLKHTWKVKEGLAAISSAERVHTLSGTNPNRILVLTSGLDYTGSTYWKGSSRLEYRSALDSNNWLNTLAIAYKLNANWALLTKNNLNIVRSKINPQYHKLLNQFQLGVAYRYLGVAQLAKYEMKRDEDGTLDSQRRAHIISWHGSWQKQPAWEFSKRVAAKQVHEDQNRFFTINRAMLVSGRITRDLGKRWDLGLSANALLSNKLASYKTALGAEAGYMVKSNLWLSAGYNIKGFRERDLAANNYTERGLYIRLRFKFDEKILNFAQRAEL